MNLNWLRYPPLESIKGKSRACGERSFIGALALAFLIVMAQSCGIVTMAAQAKEQEALPFLSPVFGDNMVLQRGKPNTIWGWTEPGREVSIEIGASVAKGVAAADGRWQVTFNPPEVGGPYSLKIQGPKSVELTNVLVGDVWLCSGQSNMEFGIAFAKGGAEIMKAADRPQIRLFRVSQQVSYSPSSVVKGEWKVCSPAALKSGGFGGFSAVAYIFAAKLNEQLKVPIGVIQDAVGGSPVESWTGPETLRKRTDFTAPLDEIDRLRSNGVKPYGNFVMHWYDEFDIGLKHTEWLSNDFDAKDWKSLAVPGGFKELDVAETPAVCWLRKEITLADPVPKGAAKIYLGVVNKMETTYVNGRQVGASSWVENPRIYPIPEGLLKPGRNVVTVRVFKLGAGTGFQSSAETLRIVLGDGKELPLAGTWKGIVSVDAKPPHAMPLMFENYPTMPTVLQLGMLRPLVPMAIKGAIWYQGEANATRAFQYRSLLPEMIAEWRHLFGQGDFPFYIAGLPAFKDRQNTPCDDDWAELREAQAMTARKVPNVGLAVTIDTGEGKDIHPKEKKPVGERLALCALRGTYGEQVVASGPTVRSVDRVDQALRIHFENTDGGLVVRGERLGEFSVAGADRKWHWAEARIEGDTIMVSSPEVPLPVAVRYAWQGNPLATLFNGAGLPAMPFRSDDWPGITEKAKPW